MSAGRGREGTAILMPRLRQVVLRWGKRLDGLVSGGGGRRRRQKASKRASKSVESSGRQMDRTGENVFDPRREMLN